MTSAAESLIDAALITALAPLGAIASGERVAVAPLRLPLDATRECLVLWQPDSGGSDWSLVVYARPVATADTAAPLARLAVHLPNRGAEPSVFWETADDAFRAWAAAELPAIVRNLASRQPADLAAVQALAGVGSSLSRKLSGLLPHAIVLAGLAAFAYMFGVVNIH